MICSLLKTLTIPALFLPALVFSQTKTFEYTGYAQTYVVPNGVYTLQVDMYGASGGWNDYSGVRYDNYLPGKGGRVQANLAVEPGQTLYIYVGEKGGDASSGIGGNPGFNGGGAGNTSTTYSGGGGGGSSDIRINGTDLDNRVLVAGGGGGAAYNYADGGDNGGDGGGLTGSDGFSNHKQEDESRGRGATQDKGGMGGQWPSYEKAGDGTRGIGGNGPAGTCGTGGGGGYYGGGGGCWSGGGGGSSYAGKRTSNVKHEQGVHEGNGKVIIKTGFGDPVENCADPRVIISGPTTICEGEALWFNAVSNYGAYMSWDNGIQNNISFIPPVGKSTYTVTSSNSKECSYSVEVTVLSRELKATTTNGIICEGETTTLIGFGGENYTWDKGVQNNVAFIPPVGVNNYTVRSYSSNTTSQCANEASVFVVVNKVTATAVVDPGTYTKAASIDLSPAGGTFPYSFVWTQNGNEISRTEDLSGLSSGTYEVLVVDAIGCSTRQTFTVGNTFQHTHPEGLKAEMTSDQLYLNVTYNGMFDYKIVNDRGEILITGSVNNAGRIDVSRLPSGNYRICSLYNTTADNVNFVKW
ncbi:MAG: hypothetical protein HYZ14_06135 [Bacteroidetes bacterium]|nr:hypothetical protein [Bacteroidota bacterium]